MPSANKLVDSCETLISLPEIYLRVREVIDDPHSSMEDLANALSLDPSMTARVLQLVNSPLYGIPRKIDTLSQAVNLLGMRPVANVVFATNVAKAFAQLPPSVMNMTDYWRKSVLCALVAVQLARACGMQDSERLFVAGLLRDVGHLVLYYTVPERAQSALIEAANFNQPLDEVERANIGCDYADVGGDLMKKWEMPERLEQAIRWQLTPLRASKAERDAAIVKVAGACADCFETLGAKFELPAAGMEDALALLRITEDEVNKLVLEAQTQQRETLAMIYPAAMTIAA
jgi:HD-like signal output (HDOD) protein